MGLARARRYLLLNEVIDAAQAAQVGLVDQVVEDAMLVAEAEQAVLKLSKGPTRAYGEIRRVFSRALGQPFEAQMEDEAQGLARAAATLDAREGITAFVEKRKPNFQGR
jgi:2-(1,2-epoxy-1,2-dihydrophenyl)acetyl-CoA isomerase